MSEPREPESSPEDEPRPTPFDHPFFLPVLLLGLGIWFFYDGWFNPEIKAKMFNKVGAVLLLSGAAISGFRALRERRREHREPPAPH